MSIRKLGNGKYLVEYYAIDSVTGNRLHKNKTVYGLKEAKEFEGSLSKYKDTTNKIKTLREVFFDSLSRSEGSDLTIKTYKARFDKYVPIKDRKILLLKKKDIIDWWSWLKDQPISGATKNELLHYIRSTYAYANEIYDIPNISNCIKAVHYEKKEKEVLTPEEFERFINVVDKPIFKAYFHTAYWTGLRRGELKGLHKDDLVGDCLYVRRSLPYTEENECLKNGSHLRVVKLDKETLDMLIPLAQRKGTYLFGDDTYIPNTTSNRLLKQWLKKAGITKNITTHNFRHSHGSVLLDSGLDLASVAMRLGHKDITTTANIYSHVLDKSGQKSVDIIDNIRAKIIR